MRVYFDNAATAPLLPEVLGAMTETLGSLYGNASSIHREGRQARMAIESVRKVVAMGLNASIGEVFFTSGGTECNNMVLKNAVRDFGVQRIISAQTEHHAVLHSLQSMEKQGIVTVEFVTLDAFGRVDMAHLGALLAMSEAKTLVSLMHANNEVGAVIDLGAVGQLCRKYGAYFHSDAVQTAGKLRIDVQQMPVDFLSVSAHKFHGPKGVGVLYMRQETTLRPFIDGGGQERNIRGGTENTAGIVGLGVAFSAAMRDMNVRREAIANLHAYMLGRLRDVFADLVVNSPDEGLHTILSVSFPPSMRNEMLLMNLDIHGIAASGGSACSSGAEGGSHVLTALGCDPDRKTIRFSFSHLNTTDEVDYVVDTLQKVYFG